MARSVYSIVGICGNLAGFFVGWQFVGQLFVEIYQRQLRFDFIFVNGRLLLELGKCRFCIFKPLNLILIIVIERILSRDFDIPQYKTSVTMSSSRGNVNATLGGAAVDDVIGNVRHHSFLLLPRKEGSLQKLLKQNGTQSNDCHEMRVILEGAHCRQKEKQGIFREEQECESAHGYVSTLVPDGLPSLMQYVVHVSADQDKYEAPTE
mmetsp:Transcript_8916/g.15698  ORF Transcript_8916/g.15698 Transcript_8916/m.15698 type:complete len:207 (-) Transcript_8916:701-1321(-)